MESIPHHADQLPTSNPDVAGRVVRWLAIGGVVFGISQVVATAAMLAAWWPSPIRQSIPLETTYRLVLTVSIVAPLLLVLGSAGLLRQKGWARPVLTSYAILQILGSLATMVVRFAMTPPPTPEWTVGQQLAFALSVVGDLVLHCLYPAAIILCLVRPGLVKLASPAASTFPVLPPAPAPAPGHANG
jgi:hypothetical protein